MLTNSIDYFYNDNTFKFWKIVGNNFVFSRTGQLRFNKANPFVMLAACCGVLWDCLGPHQMAKVVGRQSGRPAGLKAKAEIETLWPRVMAFLIIYKKHKAYGKQIQTLQNRTK